MQIPFTTPLPTSLREFSYLCCLGPPPPRPLPGPLPKVDTRFFRRTQWSQERYESLMSDVTAPGRGNVLKT